MAFVIGSYQAVEHPGGGHRASAAGLWRGEDLRTLNDVAMTVLPAECADFARIEVDAVSALRHPHLLPVIDVVQDADRAAVVCPWPAGGRLAELVVRRGRLPASETLTVLIPLASALAAAHAAGVGHGGVCPETVWFDAHGRPLLGAPAVSRVIAGLNDGLPAGIRDVAPEVVRGEKVAGEAGPDDPVQDDSGLDDAVVGDSGTNDRFAGSSIPARPTAAADVFSMGSVALFCLTGRSAWPADDPADVLVQSAAGQWPDPPDDAGSAELITLLREMLRRTPGRRPSAADLCQRLLRCGDPTPILFSPGPSPIPASADRWRGWSAGPRIERSPIESVSAEPDELESTAGEAIGRGASDEEPIDELPDTDSDVRPDDRVQRRRTHPQAAANRRNTPLARAGLALLGGLLVTVIAVQVGAWMSGHDQPESPSIGAAVASVAVAAVADSASAAGSAAVPDPAVAEPGATGPVATVPAASEAVAGGSVPSAASMGPSGVDGVVPAWSDVIAGLDAARGRALNDADVAKLDDVYVDRTSTAGAADVAVIAQLAGQGLRVVDGVHQIVSVTLADPVTEGPADASSAAGGGQIRLVVVDTLPSHPVVDAAGRQVGRTASRAEERRILVLSLTSAGYRISSIEAE